MTTTSASSLGDRLLAQVELAQTRLETFQSNIARTSSDMRSAFSGQVDRVAQRRADLASQIREFPDLKVGTSTAVDDLSAAIDTLEADIDAAGED
jgi:hypothetical protein